MSEPNEMNAHAHDISAEVEVSAEELRALSDLPNAPTRNASPSQVQTSRSSDGRKAISRVTLPLGLVVAAIVAGGAFHTFVSSGGSGQPSRTTLAQAAAQPQWPEPAPTEDPVHFANPFDASEVFELPPGTSEAEAREAVADFLIERASNRQARLRATPTGKR